MEKEDLYQDRMSQEDEWSIDRSLEEGKNKEQEREQGTNHRHHQWNRSSAANQTRLYRGLSANV